MSELPVQWSGHAPDLVRDNKLMHERLAAQDREIARLTAALSMDRKGLRESFDRLQETVEKLMTALPQGAKDE